MTKESWSLDSISNVGHTLTETAKRLPDQIAVAAPRGNPKKTNRYPIQYDKISFVDLERKSTNLAAYYVSNGIRPGMRIALMVPPGIEFVSQVFALFKCGAVIILIDPGMGRKNMIQCLSDAKPLGMVGIRLAHVARTLFRSRFPECKLNFVVDSRWWPGCKSTVSIPEVNANSFVPLNVSRENEAAIIFTTGSTGPPKGVLYRHRIFIEQAQQIRDYFSIKPGTTDVSGFPLFALFNTAMGATTVFPVMDPTRPADVHPPNIIDAVNQFDADQSFGSPALWNTMSSYCEQRSIQLPTLKRILTAGAPVPPDVLQRIKGIISPDGDIFTPYGATESLPVACNSATEILAETATKTNNGGGTCVGRRFPAMNWKVIEICDNPISEISHAKLVGPGAIGELIVQGAVVTDQYVTRTDANADHKIKDGDRFWHRMGDVGYLDEQDRFWFCGRKGHRVQTAGGTLYTVQCEAIINTHPHVYRAALVGVGESHAEVPVLIVEPLTEYWPKSDVGKTEFAMDVLELASKHAKTQMVKHVLLIEKLPTDIRHNSKIFREQLRPWAAERI